MGSDGICPSCDTLPHPDTTAKCWVCNKVFHAFCEAVKNESNLACKTMARLFNSASTIDNYNFLCDSCKTRVEILIATENNPASKNGPSTSIDVILNS